jgi:hypothetical protein
LAQGNTETVERLPGLRLLDHSESQSGSEFAASLRVREGQQPTCIAVSATPTSVRAKPGAFSNPASAARYHASRATSGRPCRCNDDRLAQLAMIIELTLFVTTAVSPR